MAVVRWRTGARGTAGAVVSDDVAVRADVGVIVARGVGNALVACHKQRVSV